jgi:hypothetical protein
MSEEKLIIDGLELIEKINNWRNKDFAYSSEYTDRVICDVLDSVMDMIYDTEPVQPQGMDKDRVIEELENGYEQEVGKLKMISVDKAIKIINQQPTSDVPDTNDGKIPRSYKDRVEHAIKVLEFCKQRHIDIATQLPHTVDIEVGKISCYAMALKVVRTLLPQPCKESE